MFSILPTLQIEFLHLLLPSANAFNFDWTGRVFCRLLTPPKQQIFNSFYSFKLKKYADDNFKFDENGRKFPQEGRKHSEKQKLLSYCRHLKTRACLEAMWEKEEIGHYEQFLLFPTVFLLFGELSAISIKFKIIVSKLCWFGRIEN